MKEVIIVDSEFNSYRKDDPRKWKVILEFLLAFRGIFVHCQLPTSQSTSHS